MIIYKRNTKKNPKYQVYKWLIQNFFKILSFIENGHIINYYKFLSYTEKNKIDFVIN